MLTIRNDNTTLLRGLVAAHNQIMRDSVSTTFPHKGKSGSTTGSYDSPTFTVLAVSAATATNLATSLTMVNNIKLVVNDHFSDVAPHNTSTSAQLTITADATDLTTANALANAIKTAINAHATSTTIHYNSDTTNTITNANATDQTTLDTLVNEIKSKMNTHIASAPNGYYLNLVDA